MITKFSVLSGLLLTFALSMSCSQLSEFKAPRQERKQKFFDVNWAKNLDPEHSAGNLPIGTASPEMSLAQVFMGTLAGVMWAYDRENGRPLWNEKENHAIGGKPVLFEEQLIYGTRSGRLISRDSVTGKLQYSIDLLHPIESEPMVYQGRLFVHLRNHQLVALDAKTGKILWCYKRAVPFLTTLHRISTPIAFDNSVLVGFADGHIVSFSIQDGVVNWDKRVAIGTKFVDVDVQPLVWKGQLYVGAASTPLMILDPNTGAVKRRVDIAIVHRPVVLNNHLYVGTFDGRALMLNPNGEIIKEKKLNDKGLSSLVFWKNKLVWSGLNGRLYAIDPKTWELDDVFHLGHRFSAVFGQMVANKDSLAVYSSRNRLYVFR